MSRQSKVSKVSKVTKTTVAKEEKPEKEKPKVLMDLEKQEFLEDSAEDYESSQKSSDEEEKKRKWMENIYYYKCPVFRVSLRFKICNGRFFLNSNLNFILF